MTFPKKFLVNLNTDEKIFTCPSCKTPFSKNTRWKRTVKSRRHPLVCRNPRCPKNPKSTLPPRKRTCDAATQTTDVDNEEKKVEQNTVNKNEKMSISSILNDQDQEIPRPVNKPPGQPTGVVMSNNGWTKFVTSRDAESGQFFPGSASQHVPSQRGLTIMPALQMSEIPITSNGKKISLPVAAIVPSVGSAVAPFGTSTVANNGGSQHISPAGTSVMYRNADAPAVPHTSKLNALDSKISSLALPLIEESYQPKFVVATMAAPISPGGNQYPVIHGEEIDLFCSESELESDSESTLSDPDDGIYDRLEDIIKIDPDLDSIHKLYDDETFATSSLFPIYPQYDPMAGSIDDTDQGSDEDGPPFRTLHFFGSGPLSPWDYDS